MKRLSSNRTNRQRRTNTSQKIQNKTSSQNVQLARKGAGLTPDRMLSLQNTVGNHATLGVLSRTQDSTQVQPNLAPTGLLQREPSPPATIQNGSTGPGVEEAQQHLNAHKAATPPLEADGIFGSLTEAATINFQTNHKDVDGIQLDPDGIIGPKTWGALQKAAPKDPATTEPIKADLAAILAKGDAMTGA